MTRGDTQLAVGYHKITAEEGQAAEDAEAVVRILAKLKFSDFMDHV